MSQLPPLLTLLRRPSQWSLTTVLWLAAVFITLVSGWRLVHLDHLLVWHDEVYSIIRVLGYSIEDVFNSIFIGQLLTPEQLLRFQYPDGAHGWADTWRALVSHPEHGPLYYVLGRLMLMFSFEPIIGLRGVAATMSALLPLAIFWFVRELFGRTERNWPVAWVAAGLIAVSPLYVLYAHEARQYTLWLLLFVLSSAALLRVLRTPQRRWWWLYGGLMALSFYAHLLSALTVMIHAIYGIFYLVAAYQCHSHAPATIKTTLRSWFIAIAVATLLFTPWLWVVLRQNVFTYVEWMQITVPLSVTLQSSGAHFVRAFLDLTPALPTWSLLLLLPITIAVGIYLKHAPRPAVWLLPLFVIVFVGVALVPDVLFGGSRSLHLRYSLPAVLAMQCIIAWVIGTALIPAASTVAPLLTPHRARVILGMLISAGVLSLTFIDRSPTWWTKNYSAQNYAVAQRINAHPAALLFASNSAGVSVGELISIAYHLHPDVRIWGEPFTGATVGMLPSKGNGERFAFLPWATLMAALAPDVITPIEGTWQWFRVESPAAAVLTPPSSSP